MEVGQQIAEALGVEATFVEGEWDGLLAGLDAGRYDIMINGVDITEERSDAYDFSDPYAYNPHGCHRQRGQHRHHLYGRSGGQATPPTPSPAPTRK